MRSPLTRDDVDHASRSSPWDLGNEWLYSLCHAHPRHDRPDAIIAKVWLIGRSYAAAIERRKNARGSSDDFYETTVAKKIKESALDQWLSSLPDRMTDPWRELGQVVAVHKHLMDLFKDITGWENRALASKYLHFHRPDLFFIYDSRAKGALGKATPSPRQIPRIEAEAADHEYLTLVRRCQWIRDDAVERFNTLVTPRQVDKILLRITDKFKKARVGGGTAHTAGRP
jgi:hypothetical protein